MKIIDISMAIEPKMAVYKNRDSKRPLLKASATIESNGVNETVLTFNLHTGTHIDFPLHTIKEGANSDNVLLETFLGEAKVFDLSHVQDHIDVTDLLSLDFQPHDFILLKTKNSDSELFEFDFIYVNEAASHYLVDKKIRGVGIDGLGIERNQPNHPTHDALLGNGIIIMEGLRLKNVQAKTYDFVALPLKIAGVEALPLRAVLIER